MCGILGYSGSFDAAGLSAGLETIAHRGPDDSGMYADEQAGVGLGHVRLSILDVSSLGHQPMLSSDGRVVLVFNGEIYNFRELRSELEARGYRFRGHSDTEVLLNLYLEEGENLMARLNGIFGFAIWDNRTRSLLIVRDGLGVKPLYYCISRKGFAFASEIKGLLQLVPEERQIDLSALHRYMSFLWCPGEGTPFKSVRKLLPGEAMVVRKGHIERRWSWYRLPILSGFIRYYDDSASLKGTVQHLRQAVHRQMVADVPVGAFLSGGLDSSAVVAFAREQNPDIRCFTIEVAGGQEEGTTDDLPYARRVAEHLGVELNVVTIDSGRMADGLERMVWQLDEPLADPAPLNVLYISQLAQENGMKVLLSGAGGDDLFTGYRRHHALNLERWWSWLPKSMRFGLEKATKQLDQRRTWTRRLTKWFNGATLDVDERIANYFLWACESDLLSLYTSDIRAQLNDACAIDHLLEFMASAPTNLSSLERMLLLDQRFFLADHNLIYTDKMSMAAGVEVRVPFLDLELVEFAARIPPQFKQRGSEGKWVLKKAMEPYLPRDVIYRPKTGFGAPLRRWMRKELRPLLRDMLSAESLNKRSIFDAGAVQKLMENNDSGRIDASYILLSILCTEIWCRKFIDMN
ncbi:MAG: asparagine synthase (glutamine-hydrolyzing) [Chlorobiales bacterium]|nr:asparagine synthase (glutamine-hydrolyzing) [Chlorobiales bacterium]